LSVGQIANLAALRVVEGRYVESRGESQRLLALYPDMLVPHVLNDFADIDEGQTARALGDMKKLEPRFPDAPLFEAMAMARAGRKEQALQLIQPLEKHPVEEGHTLYWFALVYAYLGDDSNAVKWLERSANEREFQVMQMGVQPPFAFLNNNTGYRALKKRMGL
jgi:tetratricopeptide (TPR) repeat protein